MCTFEKNVMFEHTCHIRPIKAFHPEMLLEVDPKTFRRFLSPDSKLLWFYQYCNEQGLIGRIDTRFVSSTELKDIPCTEIAGGIANPVKECWEATVWFGKEILCTAMVSGIYFINDLYERDAASNMLRKSAIGAALSQAGFGVVSGFDMTPNDIAAYNAVMTQNSAGSNPQPFPSPAPQPGNVLFGNNPAAPNNFTFGGVGSGANVPPVAPPPASASSGAYNQASFTPPVQPADPLAAAKAIVWTGRGQFANKTLGEILGESGGVKFIQWIANDFTPRNTEGQKAKESARLILSSLYDGK